jgi:hypothetical protein
LESCGVALEGDKVHGVRAGCGNDLVEVSQFLVITLISQCGGADNLIIVIATATSPLCELTWDLL